MGRSTSDAGQVRRIGLKRIERMPLIRNFHAQPPRRALPVRHFRGSRVRNIGVARHVHQDLFHDQVELIDLRRWDAASGRAFANEAPEFLERFQTGWQGEPMRRASSSQCGESLAAGLENREQADQAGHFKYLERQAFETAQNQRPR